MKINVSLKYLVIYIIGILSAIYSSFSLAYSKDEIDDHMRQNGFPNSNYPYYENVNGCGSAENPHLIRDSWGHVRFLNDCNNHDNCYMTIGKSQNACDSKLRDDMNYSCNAQLNGWHNAVEIIPCKLAMATYWAGVSIFGELGDLYRNSQINQRRYNSVYEQWVASEDSTFYWSQAGAISGMTCTRIYEDADPHAWSDNYLCSSNDIGMQWSQAGAISGMTCTRVYEDADPHAWSDNYLCVPSSSHINFRWSQAGAISGMTCTRVYEDADPHAWSDNYLCW